LNLIKEVVCAKKIGEKERLKFFTPMPRKEGFTKPMKTNEL
jgi:hypothetical protein